jgi:putative transposase
VGTLQDAWSDEHLLRNKRGPSAKRYVYFWADGIHVQARLEDDAECLLVKRFAHRSYRTGGAPAHSA